MKKNNLLFVVLFSLASFVSCKKENGSDSDFPFFFTANVNGENVKYEADDLNSRYECGISQPEHSIGFDYDIYEGTIIQDGLDPTKNAIYVHILKYFNHDPSLAERSAMVHTGTYAYGVPNVGNGIPTINGASITYIDKNGDFWSTETGSQASSTFNITEFVDNTTGTSGKIFKANFTCKLYNQAGTTSIQVNNATIRGKAFFP